MPVEGKLFLSILSTELLFVDIQHIARFCACFDDLTSTLIWGWFLRCVVLKGFSSVLGIMGLSIF